MKAQVCTCEADLSSGTAGWVAALRADCPVHTCAILIRGLKRCPDPVVVTLEGYAVCAAHEKALRAQGFTE